MARYPHTPRPWYRNPLPRFLTQVAIGIAGLALAVGAAFWSTSDPPPIPLKELPHKTGFSQLKLDCQNDCFVKDLKWQHQFAVDTLHRLTDFRAGQPAVWVIDQLNSKTVYLAAAGAILLLAVVGWVIRSRRTPSRLSGFGVFAACLVLAFIGLVIFSPQRIQPYVQAPEHAAVWASTGRHDTLVTETNDRTVLDPWVDAMYRDAKNRADARLHADKVLKGELISRSEAIKYGDTNKTASQLLTRWAAVFSLIQDGATLLISKLLWALGYVLAFKLYLPLIGLLCLSGRPALQRWGGRGLGIGLMLIVAYLAGSFILAGIYWAGVTLPSWFVAFGNLKWMLAALCMTAVCVTASWAVFKLGHLTIRVSRWFGNQAVARPRVATTPYGDLTGDFHG